MNLFNIILAVGLSLVPAFGLSGTPTAKAQKETITIYTGAQRGTYFQFGQDIRRVCPAFDVQVIETNGSLDNIAALVSKQPLRTGHRFALVQTDVLQGVIGEEARIQGVMDVVMPMYQETVTILVNRNSKIASVYDLVGKRVAVGSPGSGVWFTATAIKTSLGIEWIQIEKSHAESILALLVGSIDAMVMVAGHPFSSYVELPISMKNVVGFIPLTDPRLDKLYSRAVLPIGMYIWQTESLETLSTRSLLMGSKGIPASVTKDLIKCIIKGEAELRRWGHPRWNEIKFAQPKKAP